jgi:GDPmannose 4,6-dehydratase
LICGISGQDGAFLARFLLAKGYTVCGTSRDAQGNGFANLTKLGIKEQIRFVSMVPEDFRSVYTAIRATQPDEIYLLAAQSSVGLSFDQPAETIQSIAMGTLNMLEACRMVDKPVRLYHAGSSECFGDTLGVPATERTAFQPRSPYAVAKASAFWLVDNYREAYHLYVCTGILYNHESPLRPTRFVTQKIIQAAKRIGAGSNEVLNLGRLDIARDWGWAPEYVEAMWLMLQQEQPDDYLIATGKTHSLEAFVGAAFAHFNLDWHDYVKQSPEFFRPTDIQLGAADPTKAAEKLNWRARTDMFGVVEKMLGDQLAP